MAQKGKLTAVDKTCIKGTGLSDFGDNSHLAACDVKDGKIVRIRPFHFDWKYKPEEFKPWKMEARGKVFEPPMKSLPAPFGLAYKKRIYDPNRVLHPLKRVDWDPKGERNPQNRGKSKYVRISWDEATDIVAGEIKRILKQYGPEGVLCQADGHGETKVVHATHGCNTKLMNLLGGYTQQIRNPDSWEGWYWGAKHVWGCEPVGTYSGYSTNLYPDISKNTELLLFWGCDPETTPWGFGGGQMTSRLSYWFTELGIKCVYICPDLNYGAAVHADKWIPIKPNTDAAMQLAIAYQWIIQDTYDKKYVATHVVGFDKFKEYVLGNEDGIPKTPKWAEPLTGVPARIISELATEWASKRTTIVHGFGGSYIRGSYSTEPARLEVCLLGMQGLGKPGVHQLCMIDGTFIAAFTRMAFGEKGVRVPPPTPGALVRLAIGPCYRGYFPFMPMKKQVIPKTMIHDAILKGSFDIYGSADQLKKVDDQFKRYVYPVPGCSKIHMMWSDTPCLMTCWNDSNAMAQAYRHPDIEFFVVQHQTMENDCLFSDIFLPVSTKFEQRDVGTDGISNHFETLFIEDQCIAPRGEAKSDYEIVCMIADKMGLLKEYEEGRSQEEWIKHAWEISGAKDMVTWEQLKEKSYYMVPTDPDWEKFPAGMLNFYNDPEKHPLTTPSGKLEFYSERLAKHFPDDKERPPVPHWIPYGESHQESLLHPRAKKYPLLCISNHGRWRVHAQLDMTSWFHETRTGKIKGPDGYKYEPMWIHPLDAEKRGIADGDVVKIFNERGGVLCGAYITERIMPGVVYIDHGARYDPIVPGELDRGGAINTITPHKCTSKNAAGMVCSGFLVEVEEANLDELRKKYPEAFNRPYHKDAGQVVERVLYRGEEK